MPVLCSHCNELRHFGGPGLSFCQSRTKCARAMHNQGQGAKRPPCILANAGANAIYDVIWPHLVELEHLVLAPCQLGWTNFCGTQRRSNYILISTQTSLFEALSKEFHCSINVLLDCWRWSLMASQQNLSSKIGSVYSRPLYVTFCFKKVCFRDLFLIGTLLPAFQHWLAVLLLHD